MPSHPQLEKLKRCGTCGKEKLGPGHEICPCPNKACRDHHDAKFCSCSSPKCEATHEETDERPGFEGNVVTLIDDPKPTKPVRCERCHGNGRIELLEHCPVCKGSGYPPEAKAGWEEEWEKKLGKSGCEIWHGDWTAFIRSLLSQAREDQHRMDRLAIQSVKPSERYEANGVEWNSNIPYLEALSAVKPKSRE